MRRRFNSFSQAGDWEQRRQQQEDEITHIMFDSAQGYTEMGTLGKSNRQAVTVGTLRSIMPLEMA